MQKIAIKARDLAEQLPELGLDILQSYDGDDLLYLSGKPFDAAAGPELGSPEERYPVLAKHPELAVLPRRQLQIVSAVFERPRTVEDICYEIYGHFEGYGNERTRVMNRGNIVYVQLRYIRANLERHGLQFRFRKTGRRPAYLIFEPTP